MRTAGPLQHPVGLNSTTAYTAMRIVLISLQVDQSFCNPAPCDLPVYYHS
jgi:hypothetical protein